MDFSLLLGKQDLIRTQLTREHAFLARCFFFVRLRVRFWGYGFPEFAESPRVRCFFFLLFGFLRAGRFCHAPKLIGTINTMEPMHNRATGASGRCVPSRFESSPSDSSSEKVAPNLLIAERRFIIVR